MKSLAKVFPLIAAMMGGGAMPGATQPFKNYSERKSDTSRRGVGLKHQPLQEDIDRYGLVKYTYPGGFVYARHQATADAAAKRRGLLKKKK